MQAVEMSATALQKFIITLMSKPAEFAALAKMEVGAFTNLLKTDANEAIKTVLRSLNEKGGFLRGRRSSKSSTLEENASSVF